MQPNKVSLKSNVPINSVQSFASPRAQQRRADLNAEVARTGAKLTGTSLLEVQRVTYNAASNLPYTSEELIYMVQSKNTAVLPDITKMANSSTEDAFETNTNALLSVEGN